MKKALAALPPRPVKATLLTIYAIAIAMAILPPLYLSSSGRSYVILGMPLTIWYWIVDALLVAFALTVLYFYEDARGELDEELNR
ncbi:MULTISPECIES: hypothetical protein [unclassified Gordonia (in: high G+C Gram-positive bacteria)]|uniref:hypothetical protein n=1 Tax=unclassified Gordonia (in: high G+C Gram-positive bacteria) TaxID=2657482 RepID=UPI001FFE421E|nr:MULTISPECIES: hypothetical protein [unclassified Gordonia (in: high G+C Gram-positive bacteria)]UQE74935.1 hypothetical protein MYK68_19945 [Gordonia sp. PP30]